MKKNLSVMKLAGSEQRRKQIRLLSETLCEIEQILIKYIDEDLYEDEVLDIENIARILAAHSEDEK